MRLPLAIRDKWPVGAALVALATLAACDNRNAYVPPPPPKVTVAEPVQRNVTLYLEATGNAAAINTTNLVARVPGFVESINYNDGDAVKRGTVLFTIEPETYKLKLDQAKAAELSARASVTQTDLDYERQATLAKTNAVSKQTLDSAVASRDTAHANLTQAQINTQLADMNFGYSSVTAPFDGLVTARKISVGEYVGASSSPTQLATIVQLQPIYVNFNVSEQDVIRIRENIRQRGLTPQDLKKVPVEVGLQTEQGYPHKGTLDYAAPQVDASTGTLAARGILDNTSRALLPGNFVRVRVPIGGTLDDALLVPETALGTDQSGRYLLVVGKDDVVEQRKVEVGPPEGTLRVITKGLNAGDRVIVEGLLRAIPGQKVEPQTATAAAK
ncbi:MAG TPA: efflux RND transporter periplasmic adaptor subunit [Pseudolabrys sp.]|nr:efflux RND transporter periplasmic adaptor subunit [Pseudolabrys sp.]